MRRRRSPTIPTLVRVPEGLLAEVRAEAAHRGTTTSDIVRQALAPLVRELRRGEAPFLTEEQLLALCAEHRVDPALPYPYSMIEAEAVHRDVPLDTLVREHLIRRLEEAGLL